MEMVCLLKSIYNPIVNVPTKKEMSAANTGLSIDLPSLVFKPACMGKTAPDKNENSSRQKCNKHPCKFHVNFFVVNVCFSINVVGK